MITKRLIIDVNNPDPEMIREAAGLICEGQLVAIPTETVYGLGANALDAQACQEIFRVKGRPQDNPLIVHIANLEMLYPLVRHFSDQGALCAEAFWPGPLTLVLEKSDRVPNSVSAGLPTVAIRMPDHPVALQLIEEAGVPIAAPSANLSGKPSPTQADHVWKDLEGSIPLILDGGSCSVGVESTVLDLTGVIPTILRPGGITREQLEQVLGEVLVDHPSEDRAPKAPGMKYTHYAPQGEMVLLVGERKKVLLQLLEEIHKARKAQQRIGILCTAETAAQWHGMEPDLLFVLGSENKPEEVAGKLYEGLRLCDEQGMDVIFAEGVEENDLGAAIMNRLHKASGQRVIRV